MKYVEGYKVKNYNDIVETNHRGYIIDIAMEEYFKVEFNNWDCMNKVMLNPAKWSHREQFVKSIEK